MRTLRDCLPIAASELNRARASRASEYQVSDSPGSSRNGSAGPTMSPTGRSDIPPPIACTEYPRTDTGARPTLTTSTPITSGPSHPCRLMLVRSRVVSDLSTAPTAKPPRPATPCRRRSRTRRPLRVHTATCQPSEQAAIARLNTEIKIAAKSTQSTVERCSDNCCGKAKGSDERQRGVRVGA